MGLVKGGLSTLTINTNNDYSGNTTVSEGMLVANGNLSNSKAVVKGKGTFAGEGSLASLELQSGAKLIVGNESNPGETTVNGAFTAEDGASVFMDLSNDPEGITNGSDLISIGGDVNINGTLNIEVNKINAALAEGTYTLMSFTGSFTGSVDDINMIGVNDNLGINDFMYSVELSGQSIVLITTPPRAATTVIWDGNSNNVWNYLKNENWLNNGELDVFAYGDNVIFNNDGNHSVVVAEDVPIGGMEFVSSEAYTFSGDGAIAGDGGLVKSGSGYLVLNENNTFTGDVEITSGFLEVSRLNTIGNPSSIGSGSNSATSLTINGGKLYYTGNDDVTNRKITVGSTGGEIYVEGQSLALGGAITGEGQLIKSGQGTLSLSAVNTLNGAFSLNEGTVALTSESANSYGFGNNKVIIKDATVQMLNSPGTYSDIYWDMEVPAGYTAALNLDGRCDHYGDLTGGGVLNLNTPYTRSHLNGDWSLFTGSVNVATSSNDGWFICGNSLGYPNASISLGNNVLAVYKNSSDDIVEIGELTGTSTSELGAGGQATNTITWKIGGKNTSVSFDGRITDTQYKYTGASAAIIKTGSGRWTLTNSNTYSGGTVIERGSLIVQNTTGSATGTGAVSVGSRAALSGTGYISGEVTVNNRAYLMPGLTTEIGNLTINNNLTLLTGAIYYAKVNASAPASDKITVSGTATLAGTLQVVVTEGTLVAGQAFRIISSDDIVGSFDAISPATPGDGLYWDLSNLNSTGIIKVTDTPTAIDAEKEKELTLYPNPVENVLYVRLQDNTANATLEIRDINGQLVYKQNDVYSADKIDVTMLPQGVYLLKIYTDEYQWVRKIIKK
ncbi:autotransporter-associated beta strand repeat-containing protein [Marinilabiliaceae bacterium D04]|uniref:Autotransporter-associated beta strand repeat-containing protein n=2 Tax=Plebeiibacterium marinum TaxID=2992111 RepID=A0AAE3SLI6_9BACT|nr:autotransporter-associated beta strand repeat-containing protein [Plebeiobacterium marinum]